MKVFLTEKNGYNKKEVDNYVNMVEDELARCSTEIKNKDEQILNLNGKLKYYQDKEDLIVKSVESAVIAGEIIKENNKKVFMDNIQKLKNLYDEWNDFLMAFKKSYPGVKTNDITENLKRSIINAIGESNDNVKQEEVKKTIISGKGSGACDGFRNVIARKKSPSQKIVTQDEIEQEYKKECLRLGLIDKTDKSYYLKEIINKGKNFSGKKDFFID